MLLLQKSNTVFVVCTRGTQFVVSIHIVSSISYLIFSSYKLQKLHSIYYFLIEALHTTCYHINKIPSIVLNFKSPEEVWTRKLRVYETLTVFGYVAYMHKRLEKLEPRAMQGFFLG